MPIAEPSPATARPNPNTYWVVPGRLMGGEYPGAKTTDDAVPRLRRYLDSGITFFVDLTEPQELVEYESLLKQKAAEMGKIVEYRRFPIRDVDVPATKEHASKILDHIDAVLNAGHTVYVHCWGGVGRTGTIVGCWLVRHGMTGDQALARLAQLWSTVEKCCRKPNCPETFAQREWVRTWSEEAKA